MLSANIVAQAHHWASEQTVRDWGLHACVARLIMARNKIYDDVAKFDATLANIYERVSGGVPTRKIGPDGAKQIVGGLVVNKFITASRLDAFDVIMNNASFSVDGWVTLSTMVNSAVMNDDALTSGLSPSSDKDDSVVIAMGSLGWNYTQNIRFISPGTNLFYSPNHYTAIRTLCEQGDIKFFVVPMHSTALTHDEIFDLLLDGFYKSTSNQLVILEKIGDKIEFIRATAVHEATHAIQDWMDIDSTVLNTETDAFIAGACVLKALNVKAEDINHAIYKVAFTKAADLVISGKAKNAADKPWRDAYAAVSKAVASSKGYKSLLNNKSPAADNPLPVAGPTELRRLKVLLADYAKQWPDAAAPDDLPAAKP